MHRVAVVLSFVVSFALVGCPGRNPRPDGGPPPDDADMADEDAGPRDAGLGDDASTPIDAGDDAGPLDAGAMLDAGTMPDAGSLDGGLPPTGSTPAPPAEVLRTGTGGFLLRGTVLAPTGPISPGEVLIVGNTITCVAADCSGSPMAGTVTLIDTHATVSAGLIDAHNHATYDFLPEWIPDPLRLFGNRYQWADDPTYEAHVMPEAAGGTAGSFVCPATKWAELRSIVHGTTTIMGQSPRQTCVDRLARNADHYHGLGPQRLWPYIGSIRDVADMRASGTDRTDLVTNFENGTWTRYAVHMAEGVIGGGAYIDSEFDSYVGREPRTATSTYRINLLTRADGTSYGTAMFIHAVAIAPDELDEAIDAGAHFVWSPSSNMLLYGETTDVARLLASGATVGLGPDWTVSGSDEMLSELRYAEDWARLEGVAAITPAVLHRMATEGSARAVGLHASIGSLAPGMRADVAVFGRVAPADPSRAVIDSRAADVRLVMIDGRAYYGDLALEVATAVNGDCDMLDACGTPKFLCAANTPGNATRASETVEDIRTQLRSHLATFGREAELLELVDCSL